MYRKVIDQVCLIVLFLCFFCSFATAESGELWLDSDKSEPDVQLDLPSFAPVIEKLSAAVVNIAIEGKETAQSPFSFQGRKGNPFGGSPFDFFGQPPFDQRGGGRSFSSLGSGFVIHPDGYIVTNNHVVERATKIKVRFKDDKKVYNAEIVGADKKTDLALLKVDAGKKLSAVVVGDSESLKPGDWVIAIGNPFRLGHTATVGIVSAKSRKVPGGGPYDDFIQTDASINPGNSGGPLFNARGEVVGVNTAIFSPNRLGSAGFNIGIGFAIPMNMVKEVISQLHKGGKVTRGWLGVLIQPVTPDVAEALGIDRAEGALVADVIEGSPAFEAGMKRGDVITSFDGKNVEENDDLPLMVAQTPVNKVVEIEVIRNGGKEELDVTIAELEEEAVEKPTEDREESRLGLTVQDVTPDIAKGLGIDSSEGVVVSNVVPDSAAEKAGVRRGDVIIEVNSKKIASTADFRKLTKDVKEGKPILLLVRRNENTIFLTLKLE